jgi:hypothetical protein
MDNKSSKMYVFLMVMMAMSTIGLQTWRIVFDNFAVNEAGLEGRHIGILQSVREIPGFLSLLAVYFLYIMKEHKLSAFSVLILGIGIGIAGFFPSFAGLTMTTLIMSFGFHYFETTNQSLTLQYFDKTQAPLVFGKLRSISAASNIFIGTVLFIISPYLEYKTIYMIVGAVIIIAAFWGLSKNPVRDDLPVQHNKMIFKKKYWLFYFLTLLAGARRQIFVAFAVFLLVKKFGFSVQEIAILFILNNIINFYLSPYIGKAIVKYGERKVLSLEYFSLLFIFVAYAFVDSKIMVGILYILDHVFYNFAIAIKTFFQKIADPEDIAPSMAVGFTINHIAAVILPAIGGALWMINYKIPFIAGAVLSFVSLIGVQFIKIEKN